jgi:hypothetical protein
LARLSRSDSSERDLATIRTRVNTVGDRARCFLATQHQVVVGSILDRFPAEFEAHVARTAEPSEPRLIAELVGFEGDEAIVDEHHRAKQFDWSYDAEDSGQAPADRYDDHRNPRHLEESSEP